MKRSWIGFGLLLVLLAGSLAVSWAVERNQTPIAWELDQAAAFGESGQWEQALGHFQHARDRWRCSRRLVACVADHTPLEELEGLFAQLDFYAAAEEKTEFTAGCGALAGKVRAVAQAQGLTWWGLL